MQDLIYSVSNYTVVNIFSIQSYSCIYIYYYFFSDYLDYQKFKVFKSEINTCKELSYPPFGNDGSLVSFNENLLLFGGLTPNIQ